MQIEKAMAECSPFSIMHLEVRNCFVSEEWGNSYETDLWINTEKNNFYVCLNYVELAFMLGLKKDQKSADLRHS